VYVFEKERNYSKMNFCQKCGAILVQKIKRFVCAGCGYVEKGKVKLVTSEEVKQDRKFGVLKEKDSVVMPTTAAVCPKCGHNEAYFYSAQTRAGDEGETRFFICTKCKYKRREYN